MNLTLKLEKKDYKQLNHRQKESFNFQKISAVLADYGYTTYRMHDDYNGADFHAVGTEGEIIKIQLKGRVEILEKYLAKNLYVAFRYKSQWYLYPHDHMYHIITSHSEGAKRNRGRSMKNIPKWLQEKMNTYKI